MADDTESQELRAALRECLRGYSDLLTVARSLLAHVEKQVPLPPDSLALHHSQFARAEEQVRQLPSLLGGSVVGLALAGM